ncbi:hypothetical protein F8388_003555 [Cannabis sativa]|uniref:Mitochondrial import inner membrane translocase subunit TIM50 n=1 Tax=Cannabis sativa TaxID=3483 RepID=A0A7J6EM70_CANSA|nr:hypothetical protein F8388_003555 [Cannabis sativa]
MSHTLSRWRNAEGYCERDIKRLTERSDEGEMMITRRARVPSQYNPSQQNFSCQVGQNQRNPNFRLSLFSPSLSSIFVIRPKSRRDSGSFHARSASKTLNFYVLKRPGVDELLEYLRENNDKFEVVVFTAGLREYASLVLDKLDGNRVMSHRLYRNSCKEVDLFPSIDPSRKEDDIQWRILSGKSQYPEHYFSQGLLLIAIGDRDSDMIKRHESVQLIYKCIYRRN